MSPSNELLDHWRAAFAKEPSAPKETPDERFERQLTRAGIGTLPSDPLHDPMWLPAEVFEERQRVRKMYEQWEYASTGSYDSDFYVRLNSGEDIHVGQLKQRLDRKAYDMLVRGVDERTIAAACHMTLEEVKAVKDRHEIQ